MHRWRAWQDEIWWLGGFINWMEKCGKESEIWFSKDTVDQEIKGKQLHYKSVVGDRLLLVATYILNSWLIL